MKKGAIEISMLGGILIAVGLFVVIMLLIFLARGEFPEVLDKLLDVMRVGR